MNKEEKIKVTNRSRGGVGYTIPELGLTRVFQFRETKELTFEELEKLSWVPGGRELLMEYLVIRNDEAIKELFGDVEPEYYYNDEDVINLLKVGSFDSFLDCLDFAPDGVLELVKKYAVSLPLNDVQKRTAILNKLNFDVDNAIKAQNTPFDGDAGTAAEEAPKVRRVASTTTATAIPQRRAVLPVKPVETAEK